MVTAKRCTGCHEVKPLVEFHRRSAAKDGRQVRCKGCQRSDTYRWREANPDATRTIARRHYVKHGRSRQYVRLYGVTEAAVDALIDSQEGALRYLPGADGQHLSWAAA